jgi:serine/threonine-protein kinase RsbW
MLSAVATNSRGEFVGHVGLIFDRAGARVAESGEAVTDPRYRGRGIFQQVKSFLLDYVGRQSVVGTYGECVTVHPYSQKGSIDLGGHETGFLLGYSPGSVKFESIAEDERPRRQSIAMMFTPIGISERETVHLPAAYEDLAGSIYEHVGFPRHLVAEDAEALTRLRYAGATSVSIRHDHNQAHIRILRLGRKTLDEVRFQLKHLTLERLDCIYVDLPLRQRGTGAMAGELRKLGFFFGCLIPEYGDGDVLRLQYLNNVEIAQDDIKTASEFGRRLLDAIFADMKTV